MLALQHQSHLKPPSLHLETYMNLVLLPESSPLLQRQQPGNFFSNVSFSTLTPAYEKKKTQNPQKIQIKSRTGKKET